VHGREGSRGWEGTLDHARVKELLEEMKTAPEIYRPSPFWQELTAVGLKQLEGGGFENFKRSVNMTYFNWSVPGILQHQFLPMFWSWCRRPTLSVLGARFHGYQSTLPAARIYRSVSDYRLRLPDVASFNPVAAILYKVYVAMLWEYVNRQDALELISSLDEPSLGNPFLVEYKGRFTSQDLCNSVHEFYSATSDDASAYQFWNVAELGAGYGRLAYVFRHAAPSSTYTIIDIPPALNVAQEYLTTIFPHVAAFRFRPFTRYEDVQGEFESSRIRFLAAHQIALLPPKQFDLFVNISSLHEMTYPQIKNYLEQIGRLCRGRFYTKQWRIARTAVNGPVITESEYPIPASWTCLYHRQHPIQRMFFHALYEVGLQ
jgi:putative sugar O-methyltransferase